MMARNFFAVLFLVFAAPYVAQASSEAMKSQRDVSQNFLGLWLVKKKDVVVEIVRCKGEAGLLCGYIAWLDPKAALQTDSLNPNKALRTRSLCGIQVMWDMRPETPYNAVYSGRIYKANSGTYYNAQISRKSDNLMLRGYIAHPILGKTSILTKVQTDSYPLCRKLYR